MNIAAQISGKWRSLGLPNDEVSLAIPPGRMLYDGRDTKVLTIDTDESAIKIIVTKPPARGPSVVASKWMMSDDYAKRYSFSKAQGLDIALRDDEMEGGRRFAKVRILGNKNNYTISILSRDVNADERSRFLLGMKIKGHRLMRSDAPDIETSEDLNLNDMTTDQEILDALKAPNSNQAKPFRSSDKDSPVVPDPTAGDIKYSRSMRIVEMPKLQINNIREAGPLSRVSVFRVTYRSDGTIGPIWIIENSRSSLDDAVFDLIKKTKFIPAQIDGKSVDVVRDVNYQRTMSQPSTDGPIQPKRDWDMKH